MLVSRDGSTAAAVGPLHQARFKHTMITLPSGEVLVIGGTSDDRTLLASTEIFDPVRFTSRPVERVGPVYAAFSTVSVLGPDLRVVGGNDRSIRLTHTDLTVALTELT